MPQMSPLMWFFLFLMFSTLSLLTLYKIFYFKMESKKMNSLTKKNKMISMNWMW